MLASPAPPPTTPISQVTTISASSSEAGDVRETDHPVFTGRSPLTTPPTRHPPRPHFPTARASHRSSSPPAETVTRTVPTTESGFHRTARQSNPHPPLPNHPPSRPRPAPVLPPTATFWPTSSPWNTPKASNTLARFFLRKIYYSPNGPKEASISPKSRSDAEIMQWATPPRAGPAGITKKRSPRSTSRRRHRRHSDQSKLRQR